jgi:transcriptional regulator with XRE-family HTH domain
MDEINREELKAWLRAHSRDRGWLAKKCGVSKGTVNNWLSAGRPIKGAPAQIIRGLMSNIPAINPTLDLETFERFQQKAKSEGKTVDELIADLIKAAISLLIITASIGGVFLTSADVGKWTQVVELESVLMDAPHDIFWGE